MAASFSVLSLVAVLAIALLLIILSLILWRAQYSDPTPLWLAIWLTGSAVFAIGRILQYTPLRESISILLPRVLIMTCYFLAWAGYELANSYLQYRPRRWERILIISLVSGAIIILWGTDFIFTHEPLIRTIAFGGMTLGAVTGSLFIPINFLMLGLGLIPILRLLLMRSSHKRENLLMALGFLFVVLFNLSDIITVSLNLPWLRLSDYSYLPVAIFFSYIQLQRFGLLYRDMSVMVRARTVELSQANETLRNSEQKFATAFRTSPDSININRMSDGLYLEINDGFTAMTGYTTEDVQGKRPEDLNIWANPADEERLVQGLREHGDVTNLEATFRLKNGQFKICLMSARMIQLNGETCILTITRDISSLKLAEEEIHRIANEMTALYKTTHDLVIERDLSKLLRTIVERAAGLLNATGGGLYLCEPELRQVRCVVSYNTPKDYTGTVLKYGEGAAGIVAESGEPLIIDDYRNWQPRAGIYEIDQPFLSVVSVPMRFQDRVIGVIHILDNLKTKAFSDEGLRVLTMFAFQAAIAIENSRLLEFEQRRRQEAAAIAEVGRDISASLQLDVVLERIALHAKKLLNAETSAVYLSEPDGQILKAITALGPDAKEIKEDPLVIGDGILGNIARKKRGEIVNDTAADTRAITIKGTEDNVVERLMGVPILFRGRLTGLIAIWRLEEGLDFQIADLDFLTSLAQQAAIAIENARLFSAEQRRRQEAETLRSAAQKITSTLDQAQAIETILDQLSKVVPYYSASVQLLREGYLEIVGGRGWPDPSAVLGMRFPIPGNNPNTLVVQERRPFIARDVANEFKPFRHHPHKYIQSWLGVPLIVRDRVIGMFAVDHVQPNFFSDADAQMVNALAGQAAIAIENARLFEETRRRLTELEIIQTIASALRIAQTPDDVFPIVLDQLINLLDMDSAMVDMLDSSTQEIVGVMARGLWAPFAGLRTPDNVGGSGRVIASGTPYVTTNVMADGVVARPDLLAGVIAAACIPIVAQHQPIGTLWVGRQSQRAITSEEINLLSALGEMVGNTIQRMRLHEQTVNQTEEIALAYDLTLEGWAKALELRDKETEGHSRRVTDLTLQMASQFHVSESELTHIRRGVLLHDIGKMGVPDQILKKSGPLNNDEWDEMRKHPQYAYDLIHPIDYLRPALDIPYCHHEKWDGSGYPRGLQGEDIPLAARIFAIVDVFDALSTDRPYRAAWPRPVVLDYLRQQSGKHFDPKVVEAFFIAPFD
jgi:PAS domain S-box-containing protein